LPPGRLPDPCQLGQPLRGADLFTKTFSFNGIEPNQWVRETMSLIVPRPAGASAVRLGLLVPAHRELKFPLTLALAIDGVRTMHTVEKPGNVILKVPLPDPLSPKPLTEVMLDPGQYFSAETPSSIQNPGSEILGWLRGQWLVQQIREAVKMQSRVVLQSVRLESFRFD